MEEEWKPIPGYEGYEVSNHGRVRSLDRTIHRKDGRTRRLNGKLLKPAKNKGGYLTVGLWKDGKEKKKLIHRLVLEAFIGERPEGMETLHADGAPSNNKVNNLRWGTSRDNKADMVRHGRHRNARKDHCKRGHELTVKNRTRSHQGAGRRLCLACHRAHSYIQYHPELRDQLQEVSDRYYEAILKASTDAPVVGRHRDARTIMDRRRNERNEQQ